MVNQITPLVSGTVVDHIPAGLGQTLFKLIGHSEDVVVLGLNLSSKKHGKKDILKYANFILSQDDYDLVGTIAPSATVSIISNEMVSNKIRPAAPPIIESFIECPNPKCVTNFEKVKTKFWTRPIFRCYFCERIVKHEEIRYVET